MRDSQAKAFTLYSVFGFDLKLEISRIECFLNPLGFASFVSRSAVGCR